MAFSVPTFNLEANVYTGPWLTKVLRLIALPCNLANGRRGQLNFMPEYNFSSLAGVPSLLVPPGSDVRDYSCASGGDVVEVPLGSGRWYLIESVDDVGKGFPNEYRLCVLSKICNFVDSTVYPGLVWPTPIP
jgi:hypothetical protein